MKKAIKASLLLTFVFPMCLQSCNDNEDPDPDPQPTKFVYASGSASYSGENETSAASVFTVRLSPQAQAKSSAVVSPECTITFYTTATDRNNLIIADGTYNGATTSAPGTFAIKPSGDATEEAPKSYIEASKSYLSTSGLIVPITGGSITVSNNGNVTSISGTITFDTESSAEIEFAGELSISNDAPIPTVSLKYVSAAAIYYGTDKDDNLADFQIQLSTNEIYNENPPVNYLYLSLIDAAVTDIDNIEITPGTYTLAVNDKRAAGTYYGGRPAGDDAIAGSLTVEVPDILTQNLSSVTGGEFSISKADGKYTLSGALEINGGEYILDFNYSGPMIIDNKSPEQRPANELDIPQSTLTADVNLTIDENEAYATCYHEFFYQYPRFDYVYILLYPDNTYQKMIQLGLLVDRDKYPDITLPAGTYPIMNRYESEFARYDRASVAAFAIKTDTNPFIPYGCWYDSDFGVHNPLVAGEVEVIEDSDLSTVKLRVSLNDNAETPHTVTCEYSGRLQSLE